MKETQKPDTIATLQQKITKFQDLAKEMLAQKNENAVKQTKILQFGFPEMPQLHHQRISLPLKI